MSTVTVSWMNMLYSKWSHEFSLELSWANMDYYKCSQEYNFFDCTLSQYVTPY